MPTIPDGCDFGLIQNPCEYTTEAGRAQNRNWAATIRALKNLCQTLTGDPDDPTNHIFNNLLTRFRLTAALTQGGNATAVKIVWNGSAWVDGTAITVYDDQNGGEWQGEIGYEGWARQFEDGNTRHSVVWMQRIAYHIWGLLTGGPVTAAGVAASVTAYSDGVNPGSPVTVFDRHGRFPDSAVGCEYQALYDFEASRYEVVVCQQTEWIATATATEDYWPEKATVGITSVLFKTHEEYTVDPTAPDTAYNTFGLSGLSGDLLHLQRSKASGNWEIITSTSVGLATASQLHRFRLTANLQIGANALAQRLSFNGAAYTEIGEIRVFDWWGLTPFGAGGRVGLLVHGHWAGIVGMEGWARKREVPMDAGGPPEYEIVWMEQHARFIRVTLLENMGQTFPRQAAATVEDAWGQGCFPSAGVNVHDDATAFPLARTGAKGYAIRNEYEDILNPQIPYYTLVVCQQQAIYADATLNATLCPDDEGAVIGSAAARSPSIFNQAPDPGITTARNTYGHAGRNGNKVLLLWFQRQGEEILAGETADGYWVVIDSKKSKADIVTNVTYDLSRHCIVKDVLPDCAIESCGSDIQRDDVLCFFECEEGGP